MRCLTGISGATVVMEKVDRRTRARIDDWIDVGRRERHGGGRERLAPFRVRPDDRGEIDGALPGDAIGGADHVAERLVAVERVARAKRIGRGRGRHRRAAEHGEARLDHHREPQRAAGAPGHDAEGEGHRARPRRGLEGEEADARGPGEGQRGARQLRREPRIQRPRLVLLVASHASRLAPPAGKVKPRARQFPVPGSVALVSQWKIGRAHV